MTTDGDIWQPPRPLPQGAPQQFAPQPARSWGGPPQAQFRSVAGFVRPVLVLSALITATDVLGALTSFGADLAVADGPTLLYGLLASLNVLLLLAQVGVSGTWLRQVRHNAAVLHPHGIDHKAHWSYLGWVVPLVSLFFPKQIVDQSWQLTAEAAGVKRGSTTLWWTLWIVYGVLGTVYFRIGGIHPRFELVIALASCAALLAWVQVVRGVSATQDRLVAARQPA